MGQETPGYPFPATSSGNYGTAVACVREALEEHDCRPRGGLNFRARCPVHESQGLTLSVSQGRAGALMHCFSGCADDDILAAIGLCWDDMFDEPRAKDQTWVPRPRGPLAEFTTGERRVLRGLDIFVLRSNMDFARFVAGEQPEVPWQERVRLAEADCRAEADVRYWRFMARCSALATDEVYVRRAYQQREGNPLRLSPEQCEVLRMRAEDLARGVIA